MLTFAVFVIWLGAYLVIGFGGALYRAWSALTGTQEREAELLMQVQLRQAAGVGAAHDDRSTQLHPANRSDREAA